MHTRFLQRETLRFQDLRVILSTIRDSLPA